MRELLGSGDVCALRALVATAEQDDQFVAATDEIDPIAWSVVNAHLTDAITDWRNVAGVAKLQPIDARQPAPGCRADFSAKLRIRRFS